MGGIAVDMVGRSSIPGLWAAGEVSSTGAHGANRLASNSLLEAIVYAARIAEDLKDRTFDPVRPLPDAPASRNVALSPHIESELRALMSANVGVIRSGEGLAEAIRMFAALERDTSSAALRNMATTALIVATAAYVREESRGAHYRSDFPTESLDFARRTMTTLSAARAIAATIDHPSALVPLSA
jgi:L-aspartate oxidase